MHLLPPGTPTLRPSGRLAILSWLVVSAVGCAGSSSMFNAPTADRMDPQTARREIDGIVTAARQALARDVNAMHERCATDDAQACGSYARAWGRLLATAPDAAVPTMTGEMARRRACDLGVQSECERAFETKAPAGDNTVRPVMKPPKEPLQTPPQAKRLGVEGFVEAALLVDTEGRVNDVVLHRARPIGFFEDAAMQFLTQLRFEPARANGRAVKLWVRQRITFCADEGSDFINRPAPLCTPRRRTASER